MTTTNMADESICTSEAIQKFLVDNGGKVSNQEIVKHFKKFLSGPDSRPDARAIFKDQVNAVASIKVEDGVKYVVLKKRGYDGKSDTSSSSEQISEESKNDSKKCKLSDDKESAKNKEASNQSNILHSHSSPSILGMALPQAQNADHAVSPVTSPVFWSSDLPPGHVPQPPPRRKYSMKGKENRGTKYEESIRQIYEEKETTTSPRNEEIREVVSPGSVKQKAHMLNKMANESDVVPKQPCFSSRRRDQRDDKNSEDDASSISSLDPRRREWILKSARSDYHELVRLLREEPKLAFVKDHNKYTALHWAAKHGNLDVIKLMAGTYKLDVNARTSGGYTPLHIAAMFGREEIMEVLINTYGADPSIRDYSGKRPYQYLPKSQAERKIEIPNNPSWQLKSFRFKRKSVCVDPNESFFEIKDVSKISDELFREKKGNYKNVDESCREKQGSSKISNESIREKKGISKISDESFQENPFISKVFRDSFFQKDIPGEPLPVEREISKTSNKSIPVKVRFVNSLCLNIGD